MPPGALAATPFRRVGLTAAMCQEAQKLEWSTKVEPDHDTPIERADLNLDLGARARFWLSLAALLDDARGAASGWLRIATDREGRTVLRMRGLRPVNDAWRVPTVLTDASLEIGLVRHLWPRMRLVADIAVEARHQHIRQVIDRSYGLSSINANDPAIADNPKADAKIRRKLHGGTWQASPRAARHSCGTAPRGPSRRARPAARRRAEAHCRADRGDRRATTQPRFHAPRRRVWRRQLPQRVADCRDRTAGAGTGCGRGVRRGIDRRGMHTAARRAMVSADRRGT